MVGYMRNINNLRVIIDFLQKIPLGWKVHKYMQCVVC